MSFTSGSRDFSLNVFVLDVSGSMNGMKCQMLQLSVTRIIEDIPENSYVGVVLFDHCTELAHPFTQITNRSIRDSLIKSVPALARGGTDIALGLLRGVQEIKDTYVSTEGANLFLVTDGKDESYENHLGTTYVDRALPTLLSTKVKVVCIAIGRDADYNLERLANETNGKTYSTSDTNKELAAQVIEATIQDMTNNGKELCEAVDTCVCNAILEMDGTVLMRTVAIDPDICRNTVFTIGSDDIQNISVVIQSPNGHKYDNNSSEITMNLGLKRIQLRPVTTEPGIWSISLTKQLERTVRANFSVKSQNLSQKVIELKVTLKEANSSEPPIIVAELLKGKDVVIGADVTATIDRPNGTQTELKLINYNNIYCNYFTDYCGVGRYNVMVLAQNLNDVSQFKSLNSGNNTIFLVPKFQRQLIVGSFKVTDSVPQRPTTDDKLKELSLTAQIVITSDKKGFTTLDKTVPKINETNIAKEKIFEILLVIQKSINSSKITDEERTTIKKRITDINSLISNSDNTMTIKELNN